MIELFLCRMFSVDSSRCCFCLSSITSSISLQEQQNKVSCPSSCILFCRLKSLSCRLLYIKVFCNPLKRVMILPSGVFLETGERKRSRKHRHFFTLSLIFVCDCMSLLSLTFLCLSLSSSSPSSSSQSSLSCPSFPFRCHYNQS